MYYFIHVTPSFIVLLLTSFIIIFFGVIVYKRSKQRWVNRTFTALTVCISLWMLSSTLADTLVDESAILFFSKLAIVGPILFAPFFTIFSYIFPNEKKKINKKLIALLFAPAVIALFFVPTKYNIESIQIKDWGTDFTPGHLYTFLFIYLIICFFGAMHFSLRNFKKCDGRERTQLTYLFLSIFLMISFGLTTNLILPLFFNYGNSSVYGPLSGLFFVIATSYAIICHRFLGINLIANKVYIYFLTSIFFIIFLYTCIALVASNELQSIAFDAPVFILFEAIALVYSVLFLSFLKKIRKSGDQIFYKGLNPQKIVKDLEIKISSTIDFEDVLEITNKEFQKVLKTKNINTMVFDSQLDKETKCLVTSDGLIQKSDALYGLECLIYIRLIESKEIIIRDEIFTNNSLTRKLDKHKIKIIIPFISNNKLIGVLTLGTKDNKEAYTVEEIEFLEIISSQIAIVLENSLLHRETKEQKKELVEFNQTLEKKIKEQTKEISYQNKDLQKLLEVKSKFLNIVSHQLRTPVGVIKGTLDMIKKDNVKNKEKLMEGVYVKSMKISEVIDEIIYAFDVESDRININLKAVDMVDLVRNSVDNHRLIAQEADIKFDLKIPRGKLLPALADSAHLGKAISILANNSVVYNKSNGVVEVKLEQNPDSTVITVSDTGAGISEEYVKNLFKPFTRDSNAYNFDVNRSGLGLYIAKKIINAHKNAHIRLVKTKIGDGSIFEISVPTLTKKYLVN